MRSELHGDRARATPTAAGKAITQHSDNRQRVNARVLAETPVFGRQQGFHESR
jgi:hypothetical protein